MPSRRTHTKSRFGCRECKYRKRRCDEERPSCSYCVRADSECVYPISRRFTYISASAATFTKPECLPLLAPSEQPTFDLMDLTLMNHFTAVTSLGMFLGEEQREVWQRDTPFEARSNPLLMHGLLSVASLHLALLEPEELPAYQIRALHHHDLGLKLFNSQLSLVSSTNCHILFTFALMLVIWIYASPVVTKENLQLDDILNLLDLVRGCKTVFLLQRNAIVSRPVGAFILHHQYVDSPNLDLPPAIDQACQNMKDEATESTDVKAIEKLEKFLQSSMVRTSDTTIAAGWPAIVEDSFWSRLRSHEPIPILIFAHYALLLQLFENGCWWMTGWSERIIQAAEQALTTIGKGSDSLKMHLEHIRQTVRDIERDKRIQEVL